MPDLPTDPLSASVLGAPTFQHAPDRAPPAHPERIGPYRILERIGEGGMGEVYKAERLEPMQQTVAIKLVKPGLASREVARRFEAERQTLALMDHPGIARVLDAGTTTAGQAFFVMDYVAGKSVTAFCDEHRLSINDRLKLFVDICDAIAHAHTKAVLHRDIKPSNVLAYLQDGKPAVKVIDFGVAKALSDNHLSDFMMHTGLGRAIGTYYCMSPEQAEGSTDVDTRSDVYSLGVLLYELLTGAKPFDPTTLLRSADAEIRRIIREVEPARPSTRLSQLGVDGAALADRRQVKIDALARQLRSELEWIPLKAMRKERSRRYDSVSQLAADIQNYLDGRPLLAGPETRSYRVRKLVRRNRTPLLAASTALASVVVGTLLYVQSIRAEQGRTRAALLDAQQARADFEAQRNEAKKQARIAEDSSNFLANIFRNADPTKSLGADVTIIQAMDNAVKGLDEGTLSVEPITEAMVRYVIGTTYRSLGRYNEAVPQLEKARRLDLEHRLPSDPQVSVTLSDLANVLTQQGKLDQAEPMFREVLRIDQEHRPDDHLSQAITKLNLTTILKERKQFDEAERLTNEVLATRRALLPAGHPDTISTLNNLAQLYWFQGKLDQAEAIVRQTLDMRREVLPAGHPHIAQSMMNLGVVLRDQRKYADAEPLCREALAMRRKALPPEHPDTAVALDNLARVVHPMGKLDEAALLFEECLTIRSNTLPAGDPRIADTMYRLARVRIEQGNPEEGERLLRDALALQRALNPNAAPTLLTVRTLAQLLNRAGRTAEAAELLRSFGLDDEASHAPALPPS